MKISNAELSKKISERNIKIQAFAILIVCIAFGIVNIVSDYILAGIITAALGVIISSIALIFMKNASKMTRGIFLTQATILVIIIISVTKGELHSMYPLLVASIAVGGIYYSKKMLI